MSSPLKSRNPRLLILAGIVFTLLTGILIGTVINTGVKAAREQSSIAPDATPLVTPQVTELGNEFTKLAKQMEPSVVNISTDYTPKAKATRKRGAPPVPEDDDNADDPSDLLRRFFPGSPFGNSPQQPQRPFRREATGSGFVVDSHGYILTNNHVIEKADHIKVRMPHDQTEYKAKLIGFDRETDLAVIKIDPPSPVKAIRVGNSEGVQVGDWAVAIGSPFGLEATVTAGIVSATGRQIEQTQQFQRFIQTDAAINPGNSGGPLLNIKGEVIGINTAIATQSGGYQGIGFALPMNTAVKVYNQIITKGRVTRGSIGIRFQTEKLETLKGLGGFKQGVLVSDVTKGGPAEQGGIRPEDILLTLNGRPIKDGDDLVSRVAETQVGESLTIGLDRGGQRMEKKVVVQDRREVFKNDPQFADASQPEELKPEESTQVKFGISIRPLSEKERKAAEITGTAGVKVTAVEVGSFAEDIRMQENDIILSVNRQPVGNVADVKAIQAKLKAGDAVAFRIAREGVDPRTGTSRFATFYVSGTIGQE